MKSRAEIEKDLIKKYGIVKSLSLAEIRMYWRTGRDHTREILKDCESDGVTRGKRFDFHGVTVALANSQNGYVWR